MRMCAKFWRYLHLIWPQLGQPLGVCPQGAPGEESWGLCLQVLRRLLESQSRQQQSGPPPWPLWPEQAGIATHFGRAPGATVPEVDSRQDGVLPEG